MSAKANEDIMWRDLFSCLDKHITNVAKHIVSLNEGAELLIAHPKLCGNESTKLINHLVKTRAENIGATNYSERFTSYKSVVEREVRYKIFTEKLGRK
jgi:hypothetical protein